MESCGADPSSKSKIHMTNRSRRNHSPHTFAQVLAGVVVDALMHPDPTTVLLTAVGFALVHYDTPPFVATHVATAFGSSFCFTRLAATALDLLHPSASTGSQNDVAEPRIPLFTAEEEAAFAAAGRVRVPSMTELAEQNRFEEFILHTEAALKVSSLEREVSGSAGP